MNGLRVKHLVRIHIATVLVLVATGCVGIGHLEGTAQNSQVAPPPAVEMQSLSVDGLDAVGMKLMQSNGRPFAFAIRTRNGLVACTHFDIDVMGKAGIAAAMAKDWSANGFEGELGAKVIKVNGPASIQGVEKGMTVRESLLRMSGLSAAAERVERAVSEQGKDDADWYYFQWIKTATYAPAFKVLDTESSLGPYAEQAKTITIQDLIKMHGHPCDGLVTVACGLSVGLRRLYPDGAIDRTDTGCITNNSPCFGDAAAYWTGGRIRFGTQKIDKDLGNEFILYRFSTGQAIKVSLRPGLFPAEVGALEKKARGGGASLNEMRQCQKAEWDYARSLLNTPPDKAFELEELEGFQWKPDAYAHTGKRGDTVNKNVLHQQNLGSNSREAK